MTFEDLRYLLLGHDRVIITDLQRDEFEPVYDGPVFGAPVEYNERDVQELQVGYYLLNVTV